MNGPESDHAPPSTTAKVYASLRIAFALRGVTEAWVNLIVHRIAPVVAPLDWLLAPPRVRLHATAWLSWLLFPLAFLAYTLIRGPLVHWYPYPFLDPSSAATARSPSLARSSPSECFCSPC